MTIKEDDQEKADAAKGAPEEKTNKQTKRTWRPTKKEREKKRR